MQQSDIGKKIINIAPLLDLFEAQEGEVFHIIGKTGQGKTYEATRRALKYLFSGYTVYTTWHLNLPDVYDERQHFWPVLRNILTFRKNFFVFDLKKNWHHLDIDRLDLIQFIAKLTDCVLMMDEGQDVFDSHDRATKDARKTITRMRHMHKTLFIISQRAQAVDVNARGNVSIFFRCEKLNFPFVPTYFRVRQTEDVDDSNSYPIWVRHNSTGEIVWEAPVYHGAFARRYIYNAYDSWYLRNNMERSQEIELHAYELRFWDKLRALRGTIFKKKSTAPLIPTPERVYNKAHEPIRSEPPKEVKRSIRDVRRVVRLKVQPQGAKAVAKEVKKLPDKTLLM